MKRCIVILFALSPFCLVSCVKTDVPAECPGDFTAYHMFMCVKHRSYHNDLTDSDQFLPYADYITNHFHVWQDVETGEETKGEDVQETTTNSKRYPVILDGIAQVTHQFTSWGNLSGIDAITTNGIFTRADGVDVPASGVYLHPGGTESTDIYRASQLIDLTPGNEQPYMVPMTRTKGLLSVEYPSLPPEITRVDISFGPVYSHIAGDGTYSGSITVAKSFPVNQPVAAAKPAAEETPAILNTFMAPTIEGAPASLDMSLYSDGATEPDMVFPASGIAIEPNVITPLRLTNPQEGKWELWITVDGAWEMVSDFTVEPK